MGIPDEAITKARGIDLPGIVAASRKLTRSGAGFNCLCPFHDDKTPSMSLIKRDGVWVYNCFSCNAKGDAISYVMRADKLTFQEAVKKLLNGHAVEYLSAPQAITRPTSSDDAVAIMPVPNDAPEPKSPPGGSWTRFDYLDRSKRLLMVVWRHDAPNGKKDFRPSTYCRKADGSCQWFFKAPPENRPLYGLDRIQPGRLIVLVEGERKSDRAQALVGERASFVSWSGGANGLDKMDLSPLVGQEVAIWPDNDETGRKAAKRAFDRIPGARLLEPDASWEEGFDCGDAAKTWSADDMMGFVSAKQADEPPNVEYDAFAGPPSAEVIDPPSSLQAPRFPFKVLGCDRDGRLVYVSARNGLVVSLLPHEHSIANLKRLASVNWWLSTNRYVGSAGQEFSKDKALSDLQEVAYSKPIVKPEALLRGRGAWPGPDGKPVINIGNAVLTANGVVSLADASSETAIYEAGEPLPGFMPDAEPLSLEEAGLFLHLCQQARWKDPMMALFFAGWVALAPFCGVLKWRPHLWITGQSGVGKSTLYRHIIERMLLPFGEFILGTTSEPGLVEAIGRDARPVIIEENEKRGDGSIHDHARIESILTMAGNCSADTLAKKRVAGKQSFYGRSMFYATSINNALRSVQDKRRWTQISLDRVASLTKTAQDSHETWVANCKATLTPDFASGMAKRVMRLWDIFEHNRKVFARELAQHIGHAGLGDQVGTLLAAAAILKSDRPYSDEAARKAVQSYQWQDQREIVDDSPDRSLIDAILQGEIKGQIGASTGPWRVGSLIEIIRDNMKIAGWRERHSQPLDLLSERGINLTEAGVEISLKSNDIKYWLRGTEWEKLGYAQGLLRMRGAEKLGRTSTGDRTPNFRGLGKRVAVFIPWGTLYFQPDA